MISTKIDKSIFETSPIGYPIGVIVIATDVAIVSSFSNIAKRYFKNFLYQY